MALRGVKEDLTLSREDEDEDEGEGESGTGRGGYGWGIGGWLVGLGGCGRGAWSSSP